MAGPLLGINRKIAINTGTGYAYGVFGTADSAINVTSGPWNPPSIERQPDIDEYTGFEEDTSGGTSRILAVSDGGQLAGRATPHVIAALACAALGTWSTGTAGTIGTAATAFRHRIRPLKGAVGTVGGMGTLPVLTVYETLSGTTDFQYAHRDCLVNTFSLTGSRKSWLTYSAELLGSGVTRSDTLAMATVIPESYLKAGDVAIFLGTSLAATPTQSKTAPGDITGTAYGSGIAVTGKVVSFNWAVNNNLLADDGYGMNSGTVRDHLDRGGRSQTLSMVMELHDSGQISLVSSQKTLALEFECFNELIEASAWYGINLGFPRLHVLSAEIAGGPREKMTITMNFNVGEDTTKGSVLLDVYNNRSAYFG